MKPPQAASSNMPLRASAHRWKWLRGAVGLFGFACVAVRVQSTFQMARVYVDLVDEGQHLERMQHRRAALANDDKELKSGGQRHFDRTKKNQTKTDFYTSLADFKQEGKTLRKGTGTVSVSANDNALKKGMKHADGKPKTEKPKLASNPATSAAMTNEEGEKEQSVSSKEQISNIKDSRVTLGKLAEEIMKEGTNAVGVRVPGPPSDKTVAKATSNSPLKPGQTIGTDRAPQKADKGSAISDSKVTNPEAETIRKDEVGRIGKLSNVSLKRVDKTSSQDTPSDNAVSSVANNALQAPHRERDTKSEPTGDGTLNDDTESGKEEDQRDPTTNAAPSWYSKGLMMPKIDRSVNRTWETDLFRERRRREVNFVHIPKTGGSSIVEAAIRAGLNWGDCLFQYEWPGRRCPSRPAKEWPEKDPDKELDRVWWHVPLQHLPLEKGEFTPYYGMDLFGVIRNPYERAVSEFFYFCKLNPIGGCEKIWDDPKIAVTILNEKVQHAARKVHYSAGPESRQYYFHRGHWIPQYDYFFKNPRRQLIAHVLHTEHLNEEFASLMKAYELPVTLPQENYKTREAIIAGVYPLGVQNLTKSTLLLLEHAYEDDFKLGGYPMISSLVPKDEEYDTVEAETNHLIQPPKGFGKINLKVQKDKTQPPKGTPKGGGKNKLKGQKDKTKALQKSKGSLKPNSKRPAGQVKGQRSKTMTMQESSGSSNHKSDTPPKKKGQVKGQKGKVKAAMKE